MKTVYLHIGYPKCGTSAVQHFLAANRSVLRKRGYLYPAKVGSDGLSHFQMFAALQRVPSQESLRSLRQDWERMPREAGYREAHSIILSGEVMSGIRDTLLKDVRATFGECRVCIVIYLRRQDDWVESAYKQVVRAHPSRVTAPFDVWMRERHSRPLDYWGKLQAWIEAFGKENVLVRPYERSQMPDGLMADFLQTVGIESTAGFQEPKGLTYPSLTAEAIELVRRINSLPLSDERHMALTGVLGEIARPEPRETRFLSPVQRLDLLRKHDEGNRAIAFELLDRPDGKLFQDPWPDEQDPWIQPSLTVPAVFGLLARAAERLGKVRNRSQALTDWPADEQELPQSPEDAIRAFIEMIQPRSNTR